MPRITPFFWYDGNVEDIVEFYRSVFPNSRIISRMPGPGGAVQGITFELEGQQLIAFNGGPHLQLTPAVSLFVSCETQAEVDELWSRLTDGGSENRCGWLTDRFGLSWQIIPAALPRLLGDPDQQKAARVGQAMLQMIKIDIAKLEQAARAP